MAAPPPNPHIRTAKPGRRLVVLLGPPDGTDPTLADEVDYLRPIEIGRVSGGSQLNYCKFVYDLTLTGEQLVDLQTPEKWGRRVEVRLADSRGRPTAGCLFWGELPQQTLRIAKDGEAVEVLASIQPYHFGSILEGMEFYYDPVGADPESFTVRHRDIMFNPDVDGVTFGNRSGWKEFIDDDLDRSYWLWTDPEAIRTDAANEQNNNDLAEDERLWKLKDVVHTICRACNRDEDDIDIPDEDDGTLLSDDIRIRNLVLRRGQWLPAYLDGILTPYGFSWYVSTTLDDEHNSKRKIVIYDRSTGPEAKVYLQRPGEDLKLAESNLAEFSWESNVADLANKIIGEGALKEHELTIELLECWPEEDDELTAGELLITDPESKYQTESKTDVRRLFAANEAGDYCNIRDDPDGIFWFPRDLRDVFGTDDCPPRRRALGDCLKLDKEGNRIRPVLEWKNDANTDWLVAPRDWQWNLLRDQIGIRFTGDAPPAEVFSEGFQLRITGTIQSDQPLRKEASSTDSSPNATEIPIILDLSNQFFWRQRVAIGDYQSQLEGGDDFDDVDDSEKLQDYVDQVRDIEQSAAARATLKLFDLVFDYEIGDLITEVAGRTIKLNRNSESASEKRYLQVVGLKWMPEKQLTELVVQPAEEVINLADILK
jgi:hypothetical protein